MEHSEALEIIETYDLTPGQREFLFERAPSYAASTSTFPALYSLIAEAVSFLKQPFPEKIGLSLEERLSPTDERTLKDVLGYEAPVIFEHDIQYRTEQIRNISRFSLEKRMSFDLLEFFTSLVLHSSLEPEDYQRLLETVNPEKLLEISSRLKQVKERIFDKEEYFLNIIGIKSFDPLQIKFLKQRNYNGNPLAFFREYFPLYQGMSRSELKSFDVGLYQALRLHGQIHLAIPRNKKKPSESDIARIQRIFESYNRNKRETARFLGITSQTVAKYIRPQK